MIKSIHLLTILAIIAISVTHNIASPTSRFEYDYTYETDPAVDPEAEPTLAPAPVAASEVALVAEPTPTPFYPGTSVTLSDGTTVSSFGGSTVSAAGSQSEGAASVSSDQGSVLAVGAPGLGIGLAGLLGGLANLGFLTAPATPSP